jgi:methyl-accepting chemotaxis protein
MTVDPRAPIVQVMARLGRETQLHLDERHRHFKITDKVILVISILLILLACINVYYVSVLHRDLDGIVNNMDSMYTNMERVTEDMHRIAERISSFDRHVQHMAPISDDMAAMSGVMPEIRRNMDNMKGEIGLIDSNMRQMTDAMGGIAGQMQQITGGMSVMRQNVNQISAPMGVFNPLLPN